jgi:hypothetical protein
LTTVTGRWGPGRSRRHRDHLRARSAETGADPRTEAEAVLAPAADSTNRISSLRDRLPPGSSLRGPDPRARPRHRGLGTRRHGQRVPVEAFWGYVRWTGNPTALEGWWVSASGPLAEAAVGCLLLLAGIRLTKLKPMIRAILLRGRWSWLSPSSDTRSFPTLDWEAIGS